jgi:hypothetical protein
MDNLIISQENNHVFTVTLNRKHKKMHLIKVCISTYVLL